MSEVVVFALWLVGTLGLGLWCVPAGSGSRALPGAVTAALALLAGIALQAPLEGAAFWIGCSPPQVFFGMQGLGVVGLVAWGIANRSRFRRPSIGPLRWFEWLVVALLFEKGVFAVWELAKLPTTFEDPVFHWSGRGRLLFGGVNWSWEPGERFLGLVPWNRHYPLLIPLLRATLCGGVGHWCDGLSRADGLVWFAAIAALLWWIPLRAGCSRPWAAAAVGLWLTQPLLVWHVGGGNADLAASAFASGALAAIISRRWGLAGLLIAAAAMTKNEGLVIYAPALTIAALLPPPSESSSFSDVRRRAVGLGLGLLALVPWLAFRMIHRMGISPAGEKMAFHPEAVGAALLAVLPNPTSQIHWVIVLPVLAWTSRTVWQNETGRPLLTALVLCLAGFLGVFVVSDASRWLENEVTIYRLLLQVSPIAFVAAAIGAGLASVAPPETADETGDFEGRMTL